jgi:TPR repeat protein
MSSGEHIELLSQKIRQGDHEALTELTRLASIPNKDQARAAMRLGLLHDGTGPMGCLNDLQEALRWYRLAADLGNSEAQFFLGNMYEFGEGVPQDWATARGWYEHSANQGDINAQMNLARILQTGRGGIKDIELAAKWYIEAAKAGDSQAATNLALMHMGDEIAEPNIDLAIKLLEFSATKLDGLACLILGEMYLRGTDMDPSLEDAWLHLCLADQLLPPGSNLDKVKSHLGILGEGKDPAVMAYFVEKASDYIRHIRGAVQ